MKISRRTVTLCGLLLSLLPRQSASADVFNMPAGQKSLEFVTVGDPGNVADPIYGGVPIYGAVAYTYQIGTFEVTASQYCQFLNAVGRTDTFSLYSLPMGTTTSAACGCGIIREGSPGSYTYTVLTGRKDFPVNYVSWGDAARFCNWLANGQPIGEQGPGTTETGSYTLNGATTDVALAGVTRSAGATYVLPTRDEWHKAAYYKTGTTNAGYWDYPTRSDTVPSNVLSATGINNANYRGTDNINFFTAVGAFASSPGPYGTFDQGGNVWEWNQSIDSLGTLRVFLGGSCFDQCGYMSADSWAGMVPSGQENYIGFRVAMVGPNSPNPSNGATGVSINTTLSWNGAQGTPGVTFDIYLDTINPPAQILATGQSAAVFAPAPLQAGITYYWQVVAAGGSGQAGPVWSFTTQVPPVAPDNLSPPNAAISVATSVSLSWSGIMADVTFDVYLDTATPPVARIASGQSAATFAPPLLLDGTTYYWQIVAVNGGSQAPGPIWSFTTHIVGDVNEDGYVDVVDLLWVVDAFGSQTCSPNWNATCDLNDDGWVDTHDRQVFMAAYGTHQGQPTYDPACDFNSDGHIDGVDLGILQAANGSYRGDPNYSLACDFNNDGWVDVVDLLMLVETFGT